MLYKKMRGVLLIIVLSVSTASFAQSAGDVEPPPFCIGCGPEDPIPVPSAVPLPASLPLLLLGLAGIAYWRRK